jgi:hypothetical protein
MAARWLARGRAARFILCWRPDKALVKRVFLQPKFRDRADPAFALRQINGKSNLLMIGDFMSVDAIACSGNGAPFTSRAGR